MNSNFQKKKSCDIIWQTPICVVYCIYKIKKGKLLKTKIMNSFLLKIRLREAQAELSNATDQDDRNALALRVENLKSAIFDVEMMEFEERVGFKSMEQNAGVWDER